MRLDLGLARMESVTWSEGASIQIHAIPASAGDLWDSVLTGCRGFDFYHLSAYHRLAERRGEGVACLIVYEKGDIRIALPVLVNPVTTQRGLEGSSAMDVTSVYGYAGPLASCEGVPQTVVADFQRELMAYLRKNNVCCVFSRLHPLVSQSQLLDGIGSVLQVGPTVSIDLTLPNDEQQAGYRKGHRYDLRRLRRAGFICQKSETKTLVESFEKMYLETMRRVGADTRYMFDSRYFEGIFSLKPAETHLFICSLDEELACGGIFLLCNKIVQYHLSATSEKFLHLAPTKLMLDEVRMWAIRRGAEVFHLGGGVGAAEDNLFEFKAGFSNRRHSFSTWNWIVDEHAYVKLVQARARWESERGSQWQQRPGFFPAYRA